MEGPENRVLLDETSHWSDDIVEAGYKGSGLRAPALVAIALLTLASLVGMAYYSAPYYGYLIASGTGVIFGFLVRRKRWQKVKEYG